MKSYCVSYYDNHYEFVFAASESDARHKALSKYYGAIKSITLY